MKLEKIIQNNYTYAESERILEFFKEFKIEAVLEKYGISEDVDMLEDIENSIDNLAYQVRKLMRRKKFDS